MPDPTTLFPLYQDEEGGSSPASMEAIADQIASGRVGLDDLEADLDRNERIAVDAVEGEIEAPLETATNESRRRASDVRMATLVAAGSVRLFADSVRVYNGIVLELREEYEFRRALLPRSGGLGGGVPGLESDSADGDGDVDDAALVRELQQRQRRARELHVDGGADEAAGLLRLAQRGEIGAALRALLTAMPGGLHGPTVGNGYLTAEELAADVAAFRALVDFLPRNELVELLGDTVLDPRIRNTILSERDDVVRAFGEQWDISDVRPVPMPQPYPDLGPWVIVGPDGRTYFVTQPGEGPRSGWTTVADDLDHVALGESFDTLEARIAGVLSMGGARPVGEWQSLSDEQTELLTSQNGTLHLNDGTQPTPDYQRPPGGPIPESAPRHSGVERAQGGLDLVVGALEGLDNVDQMEANRHFASQVVFQENEDGIRRAVLSLNQVQTDGNGNVRIRQLPATINPDGSVDLAAR